MLGPNGQSGRSSFPRIRKTSGKWQKAAKNMTEILLVRLQYWRNQRPRYLRPFRQLRSIGELALWHLHKCFTCGRLLENRNSEVFCQLLRFRTSNWIPIVFQKKKSLLLHKQSPFVNKANNALCALRLVAKHMHSRPWLVVGHRL